MRTLKELLTVMVEQIDLMPLDKGLCALTNTLYLKEIFTEIETTLVLNFLKAEALKKGYNYFEYWWDITNRTVRLKWLKDKEKNIMEELLTNQFKWELIFNVYGHTVKGIFIRWGDKDNLIFTTTVDHIPDNVGKEGSAHKSHLVSIKPLR